MNTEPIEVLITLPLADNLVQQIQAISPRLHISVYPVRKSKEIPASVWSKTEIFYTLDILPDANLAPQLRWVQFFSAGIDHAINQPVLQNQDLTITTMSGAGTPQTAEFAVTMLLALGHQLQNFHVNQRKAEWDKPFWDTWSPVELRNSTIGIVGYGSVGREVARLLQPFNVRILATKRDVMHPHDSGYMPKGIGDPEGHFFTRLYPPQALKSMLKECDFVVITVPLAADTENLISKEELDAVKPGAYLVLISRGRVIDFVALQNALQDGKLAGAALDVFPEEPLPSNSPFWKMPNVIITPHIASSSSRYDERANDLFCENILRYLKGISLLNKIDPIHRY
jgi:phosphoglycerate dehydrogenase-like enzyme